MHSIKMPPWHEAPETLRHGHVIATLAVNGPKDAKAMQCALEAAFRSGCDDADVKKTWLYLRNMRWRAFLGDWVGWVA